MNFAESPIYCTCSERFQKSSTGSILFFVCSNFRNFWLEKLLHQFLHKKNSCDILPNLHIPFQVSCTARHFGTLLPRPIRISYGFGNSRNLRRSLGPGKRWPGNQRTNPSEKIIRCYIDDVHVFLKKGYLKKF